MPPDMEREQRLREILSGIVGVDPGAIGDDFGPAAAPAWDSVSTLRMVTAIEAEFSVTFRMEDIARMTDFGAIRALLDERDS